MTGTSWLALARLSVLGLGAFPMARPASSGFERPSQASPRAAAAAANCARACFELERRHGHPERRRARPVFPVFIRGRLFGFERPPRSSPDGLREGELFLRVYGDPLPSLEAAAHIYDHLSCIYHQPGMSSGLNVDILRDGHRDRIIYCVRQLRRPPPCVKPRQCLRPARRCGRRPDLPP